MSNDRHQIPELDRKGLREFALVTGGVVVGLFGVFLPWVFGLQWPLWPWILSGALVSAGLLAPMALKPVYKAWMRFGMVLSRITTPIIMGLVFFLVITPIGLIRKLWSSDPMSRELGDQDTYRIPSKKAPAENMERPF